MAFLGTQQEVVIRVLDSFYFLAIPGLYRIEKARNPEDRV